MTEVIKILEQLIAINSENPGACEEEIAGFISNTLARSGIEHEIIRSGPKRANIIGSLHGENKRTIIFNGHLDTKPAGEGWDTDPFVPMTKDGRLYGLGASDMKGGIAAILAAILDISGERNKPKGTIQFQFVADEEMNSKYGTKYLIEHEYIKGEQFAIVAEPSNMKLVTRSLGNLWLTIKIQGKKSHAGFYWRGINAIHKATEIINELNIDISSKKYCDDDFSRFPAVNIGYIKGGSHPGTVPDFCEMALDIRFRNEDERKAFIDVVNNSVAKSCEGYNCKCTVENFGGAGMPAWNMNSPHLNVKEYIKIIERSYMIVTNDKIERSAFFGGSDAGILFLTAHIPTVIFGPGNLEQAHEPNEWVFVEDVIHASNIYKEIMKLW